MPCQICGSKTKRPESASHIKTKRHQTALKQLDKISLTESSTEKLMEFEKRLEVLESQMELLSSQFSKLEYEITKSSIPKSSSLQVSRSTSKAIQRAIMRILQQNNSVNLDELERELPFNWNKIEIVLNNLYDSKVVIGSEDKSKRKLKGYIGRIAKN